MSKTTTTTDAPRTKTYSWWDEVPDHLKTPEQLKQQGMLPTGAIQGRVVYGQGRRARSYDLYDQGETRPLPRKQPTAKQVATQQEAYALQSERNRTCRCCRQVLSRASMLNGSGVCIDCE